MQNVFFRILKYRYLFRGELAGWPGGGDFGFEMNITSTGPKHVQDAKTGKGTMIIIDDWKKGDVNGGGAEITMKTNNGDIYVRKK